MDELFSVTCHEMPMTELPFAVSILNTKTMNQVIMDPCEADDLAILLLQTAREARSKNKSASATTG